MQLRTLGRWRWHLSWGSSWSEEEGRHKLVHELVVREHRCALRIDQNGFGLGGFDVGADDGGKDSDPDPDADADVDKATMFVVCKVPLLISSPYQTIPPHYPQQSCHERGKRSWRGRLS